MVFKARDLANKVRLNYPTCTESTYLMAKEFLENQMDIETLYEERKNLNQKLMELDSEINNCKVTDILNEFQIGKFYEVQYNSCMRFYWYCNCKLELTEGLLYLNKILTIHCTMMFYDRTLSNLLSFTVEDIVKWSVKEISKEKYFDEFNKLYDDIKYQLNEIEEEYNEQ